MTARPTRAITAIMTGQSPRIIVVDDDVELRALLQRFLAEHGFAVRAVPDGTALQQQLARMPADAIVLDLMMPGEDGLAICRRLRADGDLTPILMLTAKGDPMDRILGLEMGADDYLAKPFTPRELVARLSSILRRTAGQARAAPDSRMAIGPFILDMGRMTLLRDDSAVPLSSREFAVLAALAASAGRPLSRAQLIERAHGRDAEVTDRAIDVQIVRLRKALGDDPADPRWIKTVWGVGYVLTEARPC
jgi:two-component system, OmpR family, phosphate regulon response regulator OmpR